MQDSFAKVYSSKSDDELLALSSDPDSLVEEANRVLEAELERRNLERPSPLSEARLGPPRSESRLGVWRTLHVASGVAVFLMSAFCGLALFAAFSHAIRQHLLTTRNYWVFGLSSLVTALSFLGTYLLVIDGMKSK